MATERPLPAGMLAEYCGSALWSLVNWWLRNGFPRPAEEMGHLLWQLVNQGLVKTLGLATEKEDDAERNLSCQE